MKVDDIRVFVPSKDYEVSRSFYVALGFSMEFVSEDLSLFENGDCSFFLQRFYNKDLAENLMLQLSVIDIQDVYNDIKKLNGFDVKFEGIKRERWGNVIYLWGPSGELWHITEFNE